MGVGALLLGFNVAPTEEMVLISYQMTVWHGAGADPAFAGDHARLRLHRRFTGGTELSPDTPWWSAFVRFTLPGYVLAAAISLYLLWTFGRLDETRLRQVAMATACWAFRPASAPPRRG